MAFGGTPQAGSRPPVSSNGLLSRRDDGLWYCLAQGKSRRDSRLAFYERVEDERPVILLDLQKQTICAYHYEEYKVSLSKESQVVLDDEYEKALAEDKLLVLAWDSATGRLVTTTFDLD